MSVLHIILRDLIEDEVDTSNLAHHVCYEIYRIQP